MDKVHAHDEEASSGTGSDVSDLSALEHETDDFGRIILQYQRDMQRSINASQDRPPVFRKARPLPKLSDRLARDEPIGALAAPVHERAGSTGSYDSDPPLNVPRDWGRKGRRRVDWLRNAQPHFERGMPQAIDGLQGSAHRHIKDALTPPKITYTGDESMTSDWTDQRLASIDNTPTSMRRHRPSSSPSSMRHMNTTMESEDPDFTAASLFASTPPVNKRNRMIDELTRREIKAVESQGSTRRTLPIFEKYTSKAAERAPPSGLSANTALVRVPRRRHSLSANRENVQPVGDDTRRLCVGEMGEKVSGTTQAPTWKDAQSHAHKRTDSFNLLRRLARVSSMSPSPAKNMDDFDTPEKQTKLEKLDRSASTSSNKTKSGYIVADQPCQVKLDPEDKQRRPSESKSNTKRDPEHDQPQHDPGSSQDKAGVPSGDKNSASREQELIAETRVATEAWLHRPESQVEIHLVPDQIISTDSVCVESAAREDRRDLADQVVGEPQSIPSEPVQPKSALADILAEARSQPEAPFGEATMQSLEDIMNPNVEPIDLDDFPEVDAEVLDVADSALVKPSSTQAERDRRQESLAIEAMDKHLRAARASIKDANRGLRRVESKIETAQERPMRKSAPVPPPVRSPASTPALSHVPPTFVSVTRFGRKECDVCGGGYTSVWCALWVEFISCFFTFDPDSAYRIHFTWLGVACLLWGIWYLLESTLCFYYCHPLYAISMVGYGVEPDAPRFPYVIPTLLFKPLRWFWEPAFGYSAWCSGVLLNLFFGDNAASADPLVARPAHAASFATMFTNTVKANWATTATAVSARVAHSIVDAIDEVGSIWDDEFVS